ncbi:hypothetical protein FRB96_003803 [Tulasnella sp. 330]|nr:hypothetical protein FRB96_003803 [Tulasnella sp. 330]KAG8877356.1 hypothetical protein FRB97_003469 [Tulasnella sp. 331]KAG8882682.1 hypothetical protein FRB98_003540 [Tulasnella sp. 332]
MRFFNPLLIATSLAAAAMHVAAQTPMTTWPMSQHIGYLSIDITSGQVIPSPRGNRTVNSYLGGGAFTPDGTQIATLIAGEGGEGGLTDSIGVFHINPRGVLNFTDGSGYAFWECHGIKNTTTEYFFMSVDTNSKTYFWLNWAFLVGSGLKTTGSNGALNLRFDLFSPTAGIP